MKIGLLTYYGDLNCGTNLQAYATLQMLRKVYCDDLVEIVPFHGFKQDIRPYKTLSPVSVCRDFVRYRKYVQFKHRSLEVPSDDPVIEDVEKALVYIQQRGYDRLFVGADTLLELDRVKKKKDSGLSAYWLKGIAADKYVIAASCKNVEYEKLTEAQRREMGVAVKEFKGVAVRDRVTFDLFSHFMPACSVEYLADPTFSLTIDNTYADSYLEKKGITIPPKSVYVHAYGNDYWMRDIAFQLKREGYTIVSPRPMAWADFVLNDMGPFEQLGIYRHCEFCISHRFHDGVFCLKNNVPVFLYLKDGYNQSSETGDCKQASLLNDFGLYNEAFLGNTGFLENNSVDIVEKWNVYRAKWNAESVSMMISAKSNEYETFVRSTKAKSL